MILTILSIVLLMRALFLIEIQNNDDDMAHTHINDNFKIHPSSLSLSFCPRYSSFLF